MSNHNENNTGQGGVSGLTAAELLEAARLERRGLSAEPWENLTAELHYSERQLRRFYHAALAQLQFVLDENPMEK